jgi:hypothetical protein
MKKKDKRKKNYPFIPSFFSLSFYKIMKNDFPTQILDFHLKKKARKKGSKIFQAH